MNFFDRKKSRNHQIPHRIMMKDRESFREMIITIIHHIWLLYILEDY